MAPEFDLGGIDTWEIGRLMELLAGSDVEECEIEQGESRLSLRRRARGLPASDCPSGEPATSPALEDEAGEGVVVQATAVGLFYRSEKRSGPPKIEVGDRIAVGDVLGYIEVMRLPHSVLSTGEGIVDAFLVEEGQPVEYGQPLVALRPA